MTLIRKDWNVVAQTREGHFEQAKWHLLYLGTPGEARQGNLLVARVPDVDEMLDHLVDGQRCDGAMFEHFESIRPVRQKFRYRSQEEFLRKATRAVVALAPRLAGTRFCIRLAPRGRLLDDEEISLENALYNSVLHRLEQRREHATISRSDCQVLIDVETVDGTAGVSMWTRSELERYPFLGFEEWAGTTVSSAARFQSSRRPRM